MASSLPSVLGLSGVAQTENERAVRYGRYFEWPMIFLAFWIILEWYIEAQYDPHPMLIMITDWLIWSFFVFETLVLLYLVDNKGHYLKSNWGNLVIISAGVPLLWDAFPNAGGLRALRLLVLFSLLFNMSGVAHKVLGRNHLGTTLMISFIIVIMAGTLMAVIDPNIDTPFDGIWWAWVTITTVGYGDLVPGSTAGRLFGSVLILMGIALFSMLTASFSAFFIEQEEEKLSEQEVHNSQQLEDLRQQVQALESKIDKLLQNQKEDQG